MAKYQATFKRNGRETVMTIEAVSESHAQTIATFFEMSHGRLITAGPKAVKAVKA